FSPGETFGSFYFLTTQLTAPFVSVDPSRAFLVTSTTTAAPEGTPINPTTAGAGIAPNFTNPDPLSIGNLNGGPIPGTPQPCAGPSVQVQADASVSFDSVQTVSISGYKWTDSNANAAWDSGEAGLNGVTVSLTDASGNPVTDASGNTVNPVVTANGGSPAHD